MSVQLNASVLKAFAILGLFTAERSEITAATVAAELGLNGVTAHRFLRTLERAGALVAAAKGVYRLGFLLVDLGDRATHQAQLGRTLQPVLDAITRDMNEASMVTAFQADMVVCIARALSGRSLSVDIRVGSQLDGYCTANGKLWLASLPAPALARYLDLVERRPLTGATIVERAALLEELERVRRQGWASNENEREEGIRAIAVPVTTHEGRMIAGLSVFGPTLRMTDAVMARALERLRAARAEIEQAMYGEKAAEG
ncbi:transcriptional regulator, IclR family [Tistlia consotensis]|uniref:Transcriptional regulator, IclR family n=1 Tax=Tistlia consotensis USBA 355 TaxID=560819 RepID=A0A1Y6CUF2_9PROT|nr:IclR family transcriptional regulator [Tistlia consotensis]SMF77853.1 transcriptional regulator, IclR family [Tistlia consotensis USBA 355]SNS20284.1 transcriptional regulator, IclR family [Tistlia consotensis]